MSLQMLKKPLGGLNLFAIGELFTLLLHGFTFGGQICRVMIKST